MLQNLDFYEKQFIAGLFYHQFSNRMEQSQEENALLKEIYDIVFSLADAVGLSKKEKIDIEHKFYDAVAYLGPIKYSVYMEAWNDALTIEEKIKKQDFYPYNKLVNSK
ncbi:MAG: hypothetical protein H6Q67_383 [Firmicutes bacterium]|nr:hypothetical protein [Bacillota bacterium]